MRLQRHVLGHGYGGSKKEGRPPAPGATPTLGTMVSRDGKFTCAILERAADDPEHPCVAPGTYTVHLGYHHPGAHDGYPCPELEVPGRSHVQIHILNVTAESEGCLGPGERVSADGESIEESRAAFHRLMEYLTGAFPFTLEILNPAEEAKEAA